MKHLRLFVFCFLTSFLMSSMSGQSLPCDGRLIIATSNNEITTLSYRLSIPFSAPFFSPIASYKGNFDALGFNSKDNFIYGVQQYSNAIVKLHRNNTYDTVGVVAIVDTLNSYAGDCTSDGLYMCHDDKLNQILVFNVVDGFKLIDRINLFWDPSSPNSGPFRTRIYDFAIDPNNPSIAYTYQGFFDDAISNNSETRGNILAIKLNRNDPNVGMVTPISAIDSNQIRHIGGLLFAANSSFYGYGTMNTGPNPIQDKFISINPISGDIIDSKAISPRAFISDGCSCPYSFTFTNLAPQEGFFCNNDVKDFILTINNNSYDEITNSVLIDSFPEGTIIENISGNYSGNIDSGFGIGTNKLIISELNIPPKSIIKIKIEVRAVDLKVGLIENQAYLNNLPERYNGSIHSDDPWTTGVQGDASTFSVTSRILDEIEWTVTPPTDCLIANDARVVISSPVFYPGQEYEIKLRNKIGWKEHTWKISIDENYSFTLDSLIPGNYQLFQVRSEGDNCSLAVKDTSIIIDPPNEQLQISAQSNSPICENNTLKLESKVFPDGALLWTGPTYFVSDAQNPILPDVTPSKSGEYKLSVDYGYCRQIAFTSVEIAPAVQPLITGRTEICERDSLKLSAEAKGESIQFQWSGPNGYYSDQQKIHISSVTKEDNGKFKVEINNKACKDSAIVNVKVLPTPTISLPKLIKTDFCQALILSPDISGGDHVTFSWFPADGLTCTDCVSPEVIPNVQPKYSLKVENSYSCSDSAIVSIILDKTNLISAPNVFRPLSSTGNDQFFVKKKCIVKQINHLIIYDRWGNEVYEDSSIHPYEFGSWDGLIEGKIGFPGVYIWRAEVELVDGSIEWIFGDITLII